MANLTAPRSTTKLYSNTLRNLPVAAATLIHQGSLVAIDDGFAVPARAEAGLVAAGRAEFGADNRSGAAGDASVEVQRGVYAWENDPAAPVTQALVGKPCFVLDDQTVSASGAPDAGGVPTRPEAGIVYQLDDQGVWVETT